MSEPAAHRPAERTSVKETLISIIIAFVLAFVFRAFVIEAFVIPTGSMAPTLMGAHERIISPHTGYQWPVGPWSYDRAHNPLPVQQAPGGGPMTVTDPMSQQPVSAVLPRRAGDRILVLKYLHGLYDPERWEVVVFKSPVEPQINFIKRLAALPGEQVALVDGDVFVRRPAEGEIESGGTNPWMRSGWEIARKPERVQRAVWQDVFDSRYTPANITGFNGGPWLPSTPGSWTFQGSTYRYDGPGVTQLMWDTNNPDWAIVDRYPYNETPEHRGVVRFPVSDLRTCLAVEPDGEGLTASVRIRARNHDFRAEISPAGVALSLSPLPGAARGSQPQRIETPTERPLLRPGHVTNLEFWHADQALSLWADGELIATMPYDWTLATRLTNAVGMDPEQVVAQTAPSRNPLAAPQHYTAPQVTWEFDGSPLTIHRATLSRDIFYQPGVYGMVAANQRHSRYGQPSAATHPASTVTLGPDHFFVLGDNSPASSDARLWDTPDAWVSAEIDDTPNVVHRDLMIGRAFFVYFPSLMRGRDVKIPIPDFGRMRWIW